MRKSVMQRSKNDVWVGLFVLIGAVAILFLALQSANLLSLSFQKTYAVKAKFDNIGGLKPKAAVRSAGVVVGRVDTIVFDDKTFQAVVTLAMESRYVFPKDSSLKILTSGLLGEQYIGIEAGADDKNLAAGRRHLQHPVGGGAGKPDQPVPVQQGGGRQQCGCQQQEEMKEKQSMKITTRAARYAVVRSAWWSACWRWRLRHRAQRQSARSAGAVQPGCFRVQ